MPQLQSTTADHKFTLFSFTSTTDELLMCVIVFQVKKWEPPINYTANIHITVESKVDKDGNMVLDASKFCGRGKYFPRGPVYRYNEIDNECQVLYVRKW